MKQQTKCHIKQWVIFGVVALASLNFEAKTEAQTLNHTHSVILSEKTDNFSTANISARELFRQVYENRYTWGSQFPGYTAAVEIKQGKENYKGCVRVNSDLSVEVSGIDKQEARQAVENSVRMISVHRRQVPFYRVHKNSTFRLGATDKTGAVEIFEQGDTQAHYKVSQGQIIQVNRLLGNTAVTVDVLNSEKTPEGYLPTRYRSTFHQPQTKEVLGVEESEDTYKKIGNYYLLTRQEIRDFEKGQLTDTAEFEYTDIQLLSGKP